MYQCIVSFTGDQKLFIIHGSGEQVVGKINTSETTKSNESTNTVENTQRKMLICQKTNVRKFVEHHKKLSNIINYKEDANAKPPYSYAVLICLAMMDVKKKITLDQIYKWIRDNFAYYRNSKPYWQVTKSKLDSMI